jgi:GT2 family glycosyltransferase
VNSPTPTTSAPSQPVSAAIIICAYRGQDHLRELLPQLVAEQSQLHTQGNIKLRIVVVDDASPELSAEPLIKAFPSVDFLLLPENLGFAGANNRGWELVQKLDPGTAFLTLLNMDTLVTPGWHASNLVLLHARPDAAAVQSRLRLHPQTDVINTVGNRSHFLGFGFMTGFGETDTGQHGIVEPIDFPSGAAVTLRANVVRELGLFDESYGMYLEDAELGWRLRAAGHDVLSNPQSVVLHKYSASAPWKWYFNLERNRWLLMLAYCKLPTLLLLLPALLAMECGQWLFALLQGLLRERVRVYRYFLSSNAWRTVAASRAHVRTIRRVSDRKLHSQHSGVIDTAVLRSPLLRFVANPVFAAYWAIARRIIFW